MYHTLFDLSQPANVTEQEAREHVYALAGLL